MIEFASVEEAFTLKDYASIAHLSGIVRELEAEASVVIPHLQNRTVWMVSSTGQGGGVAEMLPKMVTLLEELGLPTRWMVLYTEKSAFFSLTKRLHNLILGEGEPHLNWEARQLYEKVNTQNAERLKEHLRPEDILVIHDPEPLAIGPILKDRLGIRTIWRCHIGLDEHNEATRAAWHFLRPYAETYDQAIFSAPEYIPDYLAGLSSVIHPGLDPESHKNRTLDPHKLVGILCNAALKQERHPVLTPPFGNCARRLSPDGSFVPAIHRQEIGLLYRPIVTQISRWDRLKGFEGLLQGFVKLKQRLNDKTGSLDERFRRLLEIVRLVLAGPDPESIQNDPDQQKVLEDLSKAYRKLPKKYQQDIALLSLPMESRKENALMANALQRCSNVIVQNSLREGFGLTVTEAMWKRVPVLGTHACGLRQQIREGIDGLLVRNPQDADEVAWGLEELLKDPVKRDVMARTGQRRVHEEFLIFTQLKRWLRLLASCVAHPPRDRSE
jgi:trehalose synthase